MRRFKSKLKLLIVCIMMGILVGSVPTQAAVISMRIPIILQEKNNWCWAASTEMTAQYLGYKKYSQWDLVRHAKKNQRELYIDQAGDSVNVEDAISYATGNIYTAEWQGILSMKQIISHINRNEPMMIVIAWVDKQGNRQKVGHQMVISGVDTSKKKIKINDPLNSKARWYAYNNLVRNFDEGFAWVGTYVVHEKK